MVKSEKYNKEDLIRLIAENKSSDEIAIFYNVSGRTIRNWLKTEGLETNVKFKGFENVKNVSTEIKKQRIKNIVSYQKNRRKEKIRCTCEECGVEYLVKESVYKLGSRFCSKKCLYNFRFKGLKENHPRWKGGITQKNQEGRGSLTYNEWRISVFKRDFYTCKNCLIKGKNLNAHHIENWVENESLRYEIDNGVTLCKTCHSNFHSLYGQKTNKIMLIEFLTKNGWKRSSLESF